MGALTPDSGVNGALNYVISELERQSALADFYPENRLSFKEEMAQLKEFNDVGEYKLAYEGIVANLEQIPFTLSGLAAVKLLEVGLLMRYKTERPADQKFDMRK